LEFSFCYVSFIDETYFHLTLWRYRKMYRKVDDFLRDWAYEAEQTAKLIGLISDSALGQKVTEDGRSLGFLAWHLTQTLGEMLGLTGLKITAPSFEASVPATSAEIVAAYQTAADSVRDEISANWNEETLEIEDDMYGETWKRGLTLFYLLMHQAHHRGQMTVLMRQAGLPVIGIYGPAKEEWAAQGLPEMP
jgi:uncharacterized damage-inducible protein DinB